MNSSAIALAGLKKRFGNVAAVDGVDLRIAPGEFFSLLGPSGCGKTTLLRLIAGFEQPDAGGIEVFGESMNGVPPQKRPVNTVFQTYALFPHLSVFDNVAFGLRVRKLSRSETDRRVRQALELLHVADLKERLPAQISGGQKQRVALARALVVEPKVLLLDEPLAAVDAQRRAQVQEDLRTLQRQTKTTFLYVTHDQDEALSLSDRLAVMDGGRIAQVGAPREIYNRPRTRFVASFIGRCNLLEGSVQPDGSVLTAVGPLVTSERLPDGHRAVLAIRPERVSLGAIGPNLLRGTITHCSYSGAVTEYELSVNGVPIRAASTSMSHAAGEVIEFSLPPEALFSVETS